MYANLYKPVEDMLTIVTVASEILDCILSLLASLGRDEANQYLQKKEPAERRD